MLISTANDLPGYVITEVLGEVFGTCVYGTAVKTRPAG
jgi:uncharacterized protein YbjQ (UPF0145 family)